ncbi:CocE/NonD family hydrolase [Pseudonocardia acaciae]|uniref:CocE/NonD family hydrolase n=1 Tax=Pseudonocardia acaciae TaxID=551276 RepID=UPI000492207C|nr:CocE/NonD family hydrolase [Pseudonocardia acaciae]
MSSLTVDRGVPIPLRDGTVTRADVYRPAGGGRNPALVFRTPYDRSSLDMYGTFTLRAASAGYAVVLQDIRGRGESDGTFTPFVNEREDGYDTVDWIAAQPWCDGKVGMFGGSYDGVTQWQAARSGHPALKAIAPNVTSSNYHHGWTYRGGAFQLSFSLGWTHALALAGVRRDGGAPEAIREDLIDGADELAERAARLPLSDHPSLAKIAPYYRDWLVHPDYDEFWRDIDVSRDYETISVASFNLGGWYDIFNGGTLENFAGMRSRAPEEVRGRQRMLIGPWQHAGIFTGNPVGSWNFGRRATGPAVDADGMQLRWFDAWLRDADDGIGAEPPVLLFTMGADRWRVADGWPLPGTQWQDWYLRSGGLANTLNGDGVLSREQPAAEPPDSYVYNPRDPVPTLGGGLCCSPVHTVGGVFDQRPIEARQDVLVYTSAPLAEPVEVTGPVRLVLHAGSSAPDTDWTAKLVDVEPCGYARNLTDGILRARYRASPSTPQPLVSGEVTEYTIDLGATSNVFAPGHRIRLEVSSSNFPHYDRNPNTGAPFGESAEVASAHQTVHHEPAHLSRLVLPVAPAGATRPWSPR